MRSVLAAVTVVGLTMLWTLPIPATAGRCQKGSIYAPSVQKDPINLTSIKGYENGRTEFQVDFHVSGSTMENPLYFSIYKSNGENPILQVTSEGIERDLNIQCLHSGNYKLFASPSAVSPRSLLFQVKSGGVRVLETTTGHNNNNNNNILDCNVRTLSHPHDLELHVRCGNGRPGCGTTQLCWKAAATPPLTTPSRSTPTTTSTPTTPSTTTTTTTTTNEGGDKPECREEGWLWEEEWLVLVAGGVGFLLVMLVTFISCWALSRLQTNAARL